MLPLDIITAYKKSKNYVYHSIPCKSTRGTAYKLSGLQAYRSFGRCKDNLVASLSGLVRFPPETAKAVAIAAPEQNFPRSSIPCYGPAVSPIVNIQ